MDFTTIFRVGAREAHKGYGRYKLLQIRLKTFLTLFRDIRCPKLCLDHKNGELF